MAIRSSDLLEKMHSSDKDFRFMAVNDFMDGLKTKTITLDDTTENQVYPFLFLINIPLFQITISAGSKSVDVVRRYKCRSSESCRQMYCFVCVPSWTSSSILYFGCFDYKNH